MFAVFTGRGEQVFFVVIKHLIDLMDTNSHALWDGYVFLIPIKSEKFPLKEQDQGKVR